VAVSPSPTTYRRTLRQGEITWSDGDGKPTGPLSVWVSETEHELFDLIAFTSAYPGTQDEVGCDCHWLVKLTYTVDGGEPQVKLVGPPEGGTFRTSATIRAAIWNVSTYECTDVPGLPALCDTDPTPR
jgi:hypothetical protein